MTKRLSIPSMLEPISASLHSSKTLAIQLNTAEHYTGPFDLYKSKIGGCPYFPKDIEYPKDQNGQYLQLLAQINFDEIFSNPLLNDAVQQYPDLSLFPRKGMLSFFVADDEMHGYSFEGTTDNFTVMYFPEIIQDPEQLKGEIYHHFQNKLDNAFEYYVVEGSHSVALSFNLKESIYDLDSPDYEKHAPIDLKRWVEDQDESIWDAWEALYFANDSSNHQIGGFPLLLQNDPREYASEYHGRDILLLQLSSDNHFMWGDAGCLYFFIAKNDLQSLDFSNVLYEFQN